MISAIPSRPSAMQHELSDPVEPHDAPVVGNQTLGLQLRPENVLFARRAS